MQMRLEWDPSRMWGSSTSTEEVWAGEAPDFRSLIMCSDTRVSRSTTRALQLCMCHHADRHLAVRHRQASETVRIAYIWNPFPACSAE